MTTISKSKKEPKGYFMLPSVARKRLLNVLPTNVLINCVTLDDEIMNDVKALCRTTIKVTVDVQSETEIKIKSEGIGSMQEAPMPECYLKCTTVEEQLEYLTKRFKCAITVFFNHPRRYPERIFKLVEGMNVVCVHCCECEGDRTREALELLPNSTKEVIVVNNPQIENFENIFGRPFDYLEFHAQNIMELSDIFCLNCKDINIWNCIMTEEHLLTLLKAWEGGWNPSMSLCCIQSRKKEFHGNFLMRVMNKIPHTVLPLSEVEIFKEKSAMWSTGSNLIEGAFIISGKINGNKKRTAKFYVESMGAVHRFKFIAQK